MKKIPIAAAPRKADSSCDATLNPVELDSKEIVSWAVAFPRPGSETPPPMPLWRTDVTIGTALA